MLLVAREETTDNSISTVTTDITDGIKGLREANFSFVTSGNNSANIINGTSGNDIINGAAGADIISGGAGDDDISGGADGDGAEDDHLGGGRGLSCDGSGMDEDDAKQGVGIGTVFS